MQKPSLPHDEAERLASLHRYEVLDTAAEPLFDDLTRLASIICQAPVALVSLVDRDRLWLKSNIGLDRRELPREISFCGHAILGRDVMLVADATRDPRFSDNPLVTSKPGFRFYAGAPLVTPDGHAIGTLCVADYSPRELDPAQLDALSVLARQVVALLELRLKVAEVEESRNRITAADRAKSRVLATVSHEMLTPLGIVLGFAEELRDGNPGDADRRELANVIVKNCEQLVGHVEDGLMISEIDLGGVRAIRERFELRGMLEELAREFTRLASERGLSLDVRVAEGVPDEVWSDRRHLHQILAKLLSNAVKFTRKGGVSIDASCANDGAVLRISVSDTGIGIASGEVASIFQRFHQADTSDSRKFSGTGLGLAIANELAAILGGRIEVESEPDKGSCFTIELPITS